MNKVKKGEVLYERREVTDFKDMLEKSTEKYGNKIAFRYKENEKIVEITFNEFNSDVTCLGTSLINLGLKDKRIAIVGNNSYKWVVSYFATVCGTGIVVPIDKALPINEMENLLNKSEAEAVFFDSKYSEYMINIKKNSKFLKHCISFEKIENEDVSSFDSLIKKGRELLEQNDKSFINAKVNSRELSVLLFTSGTTSNSKGVMLSQYNICSNIMDLSTVLKFKDSDIMLSFLPIHHTLEATVTMIGGIYNGCTVAFSDGLKYVVQNLSDFNISIFTTVPLVLENLYKKVQQQVQVSEGKVTGEDIFRRIAPNLRLTLVGAAPLNKDIIKGLIGFGVTVHQGYGLTETSPVLTVETDNMKKPGSIGVCLPEVDIKIDNPNEQGLGEIVAKGPNVMIGYYNNEGATKEVLKDGWLYTGDLGYVDEDGFLFISGRKKNVIVLKNGKNIFPEELEVLLNASPYVAESFVYSEEDKDGDLKLCARIVYNKEVIENEHSGATEKDIFKIMEEHKKEVNKLVPNYKYIRNISITDVPLAKTTTGKIKRYAQTI